MATVTGLTAERMLEIEGESVVEGEIVGSNLILTKHNGDTIDAGPVIGPQGPTGPMGPSGVASIPGEVKLWPGGVLPAQGPYGKWVWADGAVYAVASYPIAAGHIHTSWRTFAGASDPGAPNFRVPDLRGLVPAGLDAMPGGARANRMTRTVAITLAGRSGEETHLVTVNEMPVHAHGITDNGHIHGITDNGHTHLGSSGDRGGGEYSTFGFSYTYNAYETFNAPFITTNPTGITINNGATGIGINNNGGGQGHENVQPTVFVPYIVRLDG